MSTSSKFFTLAILFMVIAILSSIDAKAQMMEDGWVPSNVLCKSPDAFHSVIMAESEEASAVVANAQLMAGHCVLLPQWLLVKIVEPHVGSFVSRERDTIYLWQVESEPDVELYIFSVEPPSI